MTDETRKTLAEWYVMFEENGGDLMTDSAVERLRGGNMSAANEPEDAPYSVAEMRAVLAMASQCRLNAPEEARIIATAACLERVTNWILAHERDAGVGVIPALKTVGEALADPVAAVRLEDGSQVVAFAPAGLEVRAFGADDLDERWVPWRQEYMCKLPESK